LKREQILVHPTAAARTKNDRLCRNEDGDEKRQE
jgi:hypothetical protein